MQQHHVDASSRFKSLDDIWYYGGQDEHQQEAVYSHKNGQHGEIDLEPGDVLGVAGNHWDGTNKERFIKIDGRSQTVTCLLKNSSLSKVKFVPHRRTSENSFTVIDVDVLRIRGGTTARTMLVCIRSTRRRRSCGWSSSPPTRA